MSPAYTVSKLRAGISRYRFPFNKLPPFAWPIISFDCWVFLVNIKLRLPHRLKKNFTLFRLHCLLMSTTHLCSTGLAFGPDSPPTITQSIRLRLRLPSGPINGSQDRNLTLALVLRKQSIRHNTLSSSTETPIQILGVQVNRWLYRRKYQPV